MNSSFKKRTTQYLFDLLDRLGYFEPKIDEDIQNMQCSRKRLFFLISAIAIAVVLVRSTLSGLLNALTTCQPEIATEASSAHLSSSALHFMTFIFSAISCNNLNTVTGRYSYIANPCTTDPCLPGLAYAVSANDTYYYLTIDGILLFENRSWGRYTPMPDDLVMVTGYLKEERDIFDRPFHIIEIVSLYPKK